MSIETAEKLKHELTDRFVVVADNVAELRRFIGLTGRVKTVNMNCRALVEFDAPEDISWYDIDPSYLTVVEAPLKKASKPAAAAKSKPVAAKPKGTAGKKKSPLEMAREQDAARKAAAESGAADTAPAQKKLSPLERAHMQDVGKAAAKSEKAAEKPAKPTAKVEASGKKLSPLEQARLQDAAGKAKESEASNPAPAAAEKSDKPAAPTGSQNLSPLELARLQDSKK
jgi:hypothetical protein